MTMLAQTLAAVVASTLFATSAFAQSAREIRGASPYVAIENEPAPKLIVDPPLPEGLALGVFWAQYRVENLHIAPVFGPGAAQASPRVGHLHVIVDDLPWWWADASDNNTVDIAQLAAGHDGRGHGMPTTEAGTINADLLALTKERSGSPVRERATV